MQFKVTVLLMLSALACDGETPAPDSAVSTPAAHDERLQPAPLTDEPEAARDTVPFDGLLTLDEYNWITGRVLGVIQVGLPSESVRRFLSGRNGSRHLATGSTVFIQDCGVEVGRVAIADERGTGIRLLTPCSSEVPNPSPYSTTNFGWPTISADQTRLAVEARYYDDGYRYLVVVYDLDGNQLAQTGGWNPAWAPDGSLVFGAADGLYRLDPTLTTETRVDGGQLNGEVRGPSVHPSGERVVFEYNQRLWEMQLDGTSLHEVAFGSVRLFSPTYSPDGTAIAFLGQERSYDTAIYVKALDDDRYYAVDIRADLSSSGVPRGPMSWAP